MNNIETLKKLAIQSVTNTPETNFTISEVNESLIAGLSEMCTSVNQFLKNRYDIYEIIIAAADEVIPNKVIDALGMFAEVESVPQGQTKRFRIEKGRVRGKRFVTQVGLSGLYETFRLDHSYIDVKTAAKGGAVTIDFERMLDGAENLSELIDVLTEGLVDSTYLEVQKALRAAYDNVGRPDANKHTSAGFEPEEMVKLVNIVRSYGNGAVIFAPPEFIAAMGPDAIVPVGGSIPGVYHPQDIDAIHNQGYINIFRGTPVVQIPQSFVDENNDTTWIDPQMAYILPTGKEKIVKVALEGETQINDFKNKDNSMEMHFYRKEGCAIATHHNWCIYKNSQIPDTLDKSL